MKNRKLLFIIIAVIALLSMGIFLFLYLKSRGNKEKLLEKPIPQKSLTSTKENISVEIKKIDSKRENYPLYSVSSDVKLAHVEKLAKKFGFRPVSSGDNGYYFWRRESDIILYSVVSNIVNILGKDILNITDKESISVETFSNIAKEYFEGDWEYGLFQEKKFPEGISEYRVSRKLQEDLYVQMREGLNETDKIQIQDGKVIYAQFMLSNFVKTDEHVTLISKEALERYIKDNKYPKEIIPETSILPTELDIDPYSSEYLKATEKLTDCISDSVSVIYYYKYMEQGLLTPIYKVLARCDANYKDKKYQIPVTILTNAINPKYILVQEDGK